MSPSDPRPLVSDPRREAVDSLRGYAYQLLRSIEAWVELGADELLVLEGAEDLDRYDPSSGVAAEQVKDTAANITLRSESVLEAIGNYWNHRQRNSNVPIRFRYLTTAQIGREKKQPFGFNEPGLEAWRRIAASPDSDPSREMAAAIQTHLAAEEKLPPVLRDWLGKATVEEFVKELILPIEWVTGWPDKSELESAVLAKLAVLAEQLGLAPSTAGLALDALYRKAWEIATGKGNRILRRGQLILILEEAGTTRLPTRQITELLGILAGHRVSGTSIAPIIEPFAPPPLAAPARHVRPALEQSLRQALLGGTVLIHGGTGMGKTGLALSAINQDGSVAWLDLRDVPALLAATQIDALAARVMTLSKAHDVVLDDLPGAGDTRCLEAPLSRLRSAQKRRGSGLLVTHPDRLPPRLATSLGLAPERSIAAPAFDEADIQSYLAARGCGADRAGNWAKLILATTNGHPQLVDARIGALALAGFPTPQVTDLLLPPPEIVDVQEEARRLVAALPPDERELLARASLLFGRITRRRLMAIARLAPAIPEPGHVIDRLTGPWLERLEEGELRASPLLRNYAADTRGPDWVTAMHGGIASSYLADKSLLATDVFAIATHAMLGRTARPLLPLLPGLLQAEEEVWSQVGQSAAVLTVIGVDSETQLPFDEPVDVAIFRILQLRIALANREQEQVTALADRALNELSSAEAGDDGQFALFELLFLYQYLQHDPALTLADRLPLALRFMRAGERFRAAIPAMQRAQPDSTPAFELPDFSPFLPMTLIPAVSNAEELDELLDRIGELPPGEQATAVGGYAGNNEAAALAMDRVWLGEASRAEPRWEALAATLQRLLTMAESLSVPTLAAAAAPMLVRVLDENVRRADEAKAAADRLIESIGREPRLLAAKARLLWRAGEPEPALALYEELLPRFPLGLSWRTDVLRDAAVAAGKAGDWPLAAARLSEALGGMADEEPLMRRVGFLFDLAAALQLAGQTRTAVDRLGEACEMMLLADEPPGEPLLSVRQFGSQVIRSIGAELGAPGIWGGNEMPLERLFGSMSGLEELSWGDQKPASLDVILLIMAELDLALPEYPAIAARLAPRLRASGNILTQCTQGDLLTRVAVRTLELEPGASDAVREARALAAAVAARQRNAEVDQLRYEDSDTAFTEGADELIKHRLLARVVALLARGKIREVPLQAWLAALPADPAMDGVRAMLEDLGQLLIGKVDATARLMSGNASWDQHLLAALMAPVQRRLSPEQLLIAHVVAAQYLRRGRLSTFVGELLSDLVTETWLDRCGSPAQLVTPRLSIPALHRAAVEAPRGWRRVIDVLDAASRAVASGAARTVADVLRELRREFSSSGDAVED